MEIHPHKNQIRMEIKLQQIMEKKPDGQNSCAWQQMQQEVSDMLNRYGNAEQFLKLFTPELQLIAASYPERAYFGTAPSLGAVRLGYGEQTAIVWSCIILENVNNFAGVKDKMPVSRQKELAGLFLAEYPYLKVSELLLFFHRLKCGRYGRFYGMVDALFIASALLQFMDERRTETARYKAARKKAETTILPSLEGGITYYEYQELKKRKEQNNG